ncbi:MAG: hypothetical protein EAZ42_13100 [Verrucomicrobia bacterium]|nr:MAG: hypothetical protein EAZ42_13100 [Verrucomicrobiota bacterium]
MKFSWMTVNFLCALSFFFTSCADEPVKKPTGPVSQSSQMPWNTPVAGQGQGQFGMMPQGQYRR